VAITHQVRLAARLLAQHIGGEPLQQGAAHPHAGRGSLPAANHAIEIDPFLLLDPLVRATVENVDPSDIDERDMNMDQLHGAAGPLGDTQGKG
jgi:hypothetical protein